MDHSTNNSNSLQSSSNGGGYEILDFDTNSFNNNNNSDNMTSTNTTYFDPLSFLSPTTPVTTVQRTTPTTPKNPKKRTRASRRAPTTVLTTDTSNFRQMVQEFTGIPAPPFSVPSSSSSSYIRPGFDFLSHGALKFQLPIFCAPQEASTTTSSDPTSVFVNPALPTFNYQFQQQQQQSSSNTVPGLDFHSLFQAGGAEFGVDGRVNNGHFSGLPGFIGSGWGQDAEGDPTRLRG